MSMNRKSTQGFGINQGIYKKKSKTPDTGMRKKATNANFHLKFPTPAANTNFHLFPTPAAANEFAM